MSGIRSIATTRSIVPLTNRTAVMSFLDLPRELRDVIYDRLLLDFQSVKPTWVSKGFGLDLYVRNGPQKALLLVNRQVKTEYGKRVRARAGLQLRDNWLNDSQALPIIPTPLCQLPIYEMRFLVEDDTEMDIHLRRAAAILRENKHTCVRIKLFINENKLEVVCTTGEHSIWHAVSSWQRLLVGLPPNTQVELFWHTNGVDTERIWADEARKRLGTWTANGGWQLARQ